ncbi:MAG TPA: hypothetical protein VGI22_18910 [Xanthobacteraceae bacterium]|jgi:hypothetical protein
MNTIDKEREDLETLLPWHAAGTLNRRDAERVEKALASDRELLRRFNLAREELNETIHLNETLGAPSARAMEKLFAAIDAEPVRKPSPMSKLSFDLAGRLSSFVASFSPRTLAMAGAVGALAIVLQAGIITTGLIKHEAGTEVAKQDTNTSLASAEVSDGTLAAVRFAPKADASQITAFLLANKASMIDGPISGGFYTIRLPESGKAKEDHIKQMAQSTVVELVVPKQ